MFYPKLLFLLCFREFVVARNECPKGSFLSEQAPENCYIFEKERMNWFEAERFCGKYGGRLAFPHDINDGRLFSAHALNISINEFWVGSNNFFNSSSSSTIWTYSDGSAINYTAWLIWDKNQPQKPEEQRCAAINSNEQRWRSEDCSELKAFVCQIERIIPSNEWIPFNVTGYQYKVFNFSTTWDIAELICDREDSHLVSIHSKQEMIFATVLLKPYTLKNNFNSCFFQAQTWIGLFTKNNNKSWFWLDSSPYNDTIHKELWAVNEPDNPGIQNCGHIWTQNPCFPWVHLKFYNRECYLTMDNFICKKRI